MSLFINKYWVFTQHSPKWNDEFIVRIEVEAGSAPDAARKRFDMQAKDSKLDTTALLVVPADPCSDRHAVVYRVVDGSLYA